MSDTALEAVLRRDRAVVVVALAVVAALSWAYVLWLAARIAMPMAEPGVPAADMSGMDMGGMDMGSAAEPTFRAWSPADFAFIFTMWAVMMIGMMTPSVAPMVLLYATVGRKAQTTGKPIAPTGWFFAGYVLVWVAFSLAATVAQWLLTGLALLSPTMAATSAILGGVVLVAAGLYQWTPLKETCLRECQSPIAFLARQGGFRSSPLGAARLGIKHGTYCLGCCWALMALLFVGGVMNVLWIAGIAVLVLLEKIVPTGRLIPRISGAIIAAAGVWLLLGAV